jgi:hypothetical protein
MRFTVKVHGPDPLGLRDTLQRFANEQWLAVHVTRKQAVPIVLDQFKRMIAQTLETTEVRAKRYPPVASLAPEETPIRYNGPYVTS